jgi:site-specific DNA recombinase
VRKKLWNQRLAFYKFIISKRMATIIYARKSTESEDRQVQSLDDQIRILKDLAEKENITVSEVIFESKSAKTPGSRPEFERLIGMINDGKVDGVLTWAINRLNRNLVDGGIIAHLLQSGKIQFIRTPERTYKPEDNVLIMSIENGMATSFIQDLSRNVRRGMAGKCERGWFPGLAPLGYKNNAYTREIDPEPTTYPLIKKGWELLLTGGYSIAEVHRELVAMGLKGAGRVGSTRPIQKSLVYRIYTSRFYSGKFEYDGKLYQGKHRAMITPDEFDLIQAFLSRNLTVRPKKEPLSFSGSLVCGDCGCSVVGERKVKHYKSTGERVEYTYYHCSGAKGCKKQSMSHETLQETLRTIGEKTGLSEEWISWCKQALHNSRVEEQGAVTASLEELQFEYNRLLERMSRLTELRLDGELSPNEFQNLKQTLKAQITEHESKMRFMGTIEEEVEKYILNKIHATRILFNPQILPHQVTRSMLRSLGDIHTLTLGKLKISIDPVIQILAGIEPSADSSESAKLRPQNALCPIWYTRCYEARMIARAQLLRVKPSFTCY